MKSYLFEHYKKKYGSGGKLPVRKTGMWYQEGDVVVPSNEITMKGPNGEKDYFDSPILGIGLLSGDTQVMQPGKDYKFPNDNAVFEKKMQSGGGITSLPEELTKRLNSFELNKGMTAEQQNRFNKYLQGYTNAPRRASNQLPLPEGLEINAETLDLIKKLKNIPADQKMNYAGDLTPKIAKALQSGLTYNQSINLPRELGNVSFSGGYNSEDPVTLQNLYKDLNYNTNFKGKGSINLNARQQSLNLQRKNNTDGKKDIALNYTRTSSDKGINAEPAEQSLRFQLGKNSVNYKRSLSDEEKLNELVFNSQVLPQLGLTAGAKYSTLNSFKGTDPLTANIPAYVANAGIQGQVGPLGYNLSGTYNPDTGYSYQGEGELDLFNDALNVKGTFSGNQENGMSQYGLTAQANLAKGLNLQASYNKSNMNKPGSYNVGLSYNKFFEEGGEVEDTDESEDDREMVEGIADILTRVKDKKNRKQIANKMVSDFDKEDVEYNLDDFMKAAQIMQMGGMSIPGVNGMVVASSPMSLKDTYKKKK